MPFYEYRCQKCGQKLEVMQPMKAKPLAVCGEHCAAERKAGDGKLTRLLSLPAVHSGASVPKAADLSPCARCGVPGGTCAMRDALR